jgi:hypothetical protein
VKKKKIRDIIAKVASVSGKISSVVDRVMDIAKSFANGRVAEAQALLSDPDPASAGAAPKKFSLKDLPPEQLHQMFDALNAFAKEEISGLVKEQVHELLGKKLLPLLHKLLNIPKNAVGGAIGVVPFAGGPLNFLTHSLFDFVIGQIDGFIFGKSGELVEIIVGKVLDKIFRNLKQALLGDLDKKKLGGATPIEPGPWGIVLESATYGDNRGGEIGNQNDVVGSLCNHKDRCQLQVQNRNNTLQPGAQPPTFVAKYRCSKFSELRTVAAREGQSVTLHCGSACAGAIAGRDASSTQIQVLAADFNGQNRKDVVENRCRNQVAKLTGDLRALGIHINANRWCAYRADSKPGEPPIPRPKGSETSKVTIDYCCTNDPDPKRISVDEGGIANLYCRPYFRRPKAEPPSREEIERFFAFLNRIGDLAKSIQLGGEAAATGDAAGAIAAAIRAGLEQLLLRFVPDEELRGIISDAVELAVQEVTKGVKKGKLDLFGALGRVVEKMATTNPKNPKRPTLGEFIASKIPIDADLKTAIGSGVNALLLRLAKPSGIQKLTKDPLRFLSALAGELVDEVKKPLAKFLARQIGSTAAESAAIENDLVAAIDLVKGAIQAKGMQALVDFRELLGNVFPYLVKPLLAGLVTAMPDGLQSLKTGLKAAVTGPKLKMLVEKIGNLIKGNGPMPGTSDITGGVAAIAQPIGAHFIGQIADPAVKQVVQKAFDMLTEAATSPGAFQTKYLQTPKNLVTRVLDIAGDMVKGKLAGLLSGFPAEQKLLTDALDKLFAIVQNPPATLDLKMILGTVLDVGNPYLQSRILGLVKGTEFGPLVKSVLDALFGPGGAFAKGEEGLGALPAWIKAQGQGVIAQVVGAVSGLVQPMIQDKVSGAIVKALFTAVGNALRYPGGIPKLVADGAGAIFSLLKDAAQPVIQIFTGGAPGPAAQSARPIGQTNLVERVRLGVRKNSDQASTQRLALNACVNSPGGAPKTGQASAQATLLGGVLTAIQGVFADPKALLVKGAAALKGAGAGIRVAAKGFVAGFLEGKVETKLKDLLVGWVDRLLSFASDPDAVGAMSGKNVLTVLRTGGAELLDKYLADKIVAALPARLRPLTRAILKDVGALLANPAQLTALIRGRAKDVFARALRVVGVPLAVLVKSYLPPAVKAPVGKLLVDSVAFLANAGNLNLLVTGKAASLLPQLATPVQRFLQSLLGAKGPPKARSAIDLLAQIMKTPTGPAATAAGLNAARNAIETNLVPALAQIADAGARDFAASLVGVLKDLLRADSQGQALRKDPKAILGRFFDVPTGYATSVLRDKVTDPVAQTLLADSVDAVRSFVGSAIRGVAAKRAATTLLPRAAGMLATFVRDLLPRVIKSDADLVTMLGDLVRDVLLTLADKNHWNKLLSEGIGFLLSRVVPSVKDYVLALVRRQANLDETVRAMLESLLQSAGSYFSNRDAVAKSSTTFLPWLVSTVVRAIEPAIATFIDRNVKEPAVARLLQRVLSGVAESVSSIERLRALVSMKAPDALKMVLEVARSTLSDVLGRAIPNDSVRKLSQDGLGILFDAFGALAKGTGDLGLLLRDTFGKGIALLGGFIKGKLGTLLGAPLAWLSEPLGRAADDIFGFAAALVTRPETLKQLKAGGPGALFSRWVRGVIGILREPALQKIDDDEVRALVTRAFDVVGELAGKGATVKSAVVQAGQKQVMPLLSLLLPRIARVVKPFVDARVVNAMSEGGPKKIVRALVNAAAALLERPEKFLRLIDLVKEGRFKELAKDALTGLASAVLSFIHDDKLRELIESGVQTLAGQFLGTSSLGKGLK